MTGPESVQHAAFPQPGELFEGRYRIIEAIGKGGFAQVYRARQEDLDREVALKILTPSNDSADPHYADVVLKRFHQEARLVSKLRDPHTITMFDYGQGDGGLLYLVLEYIHGLSLSQLLKSEGALNPARVLKILEQVLTSLQEAHALGVLHRDIKPANIMVYEHLGRPDHVKLLDFGIAKVFDGTEGTIHDLTAEGVLLGTPHYLAPEQILGQKLSASSDIYSLGMVAYEMIAGHRANTETTPMDVIGRQIDPQPFVLPDDLPIHKGLRHLIETMVNKDVEQRFESAEEVLLAMERLDDEDEEDQTLVLPPDLGRAFRDPDEHAATIPNTPSPDKESIRISAVSDHTPSQSVEFDYKISTFSPIAVIGVLAGVLASVVLIGAIIYLLSVEKSDAPTGSQAVAVEDPASDRRAPAEPTPEEPAGFTLKITTSPPGLPVHVDDRLAGLSPLELDLHGFSLPATISARLHAGSTRSVVLTRPSHFVHLDFSNVADEEHVPREVDVALKPAPPVEAPRTEEPKKQAAAQNTRPPRQKSQKSAPAVKKSPDPPDEPQKTEKTEENEAPVKAEEPSSSPFNLPALDNLR